MRHGSPSDYTPSDLSLHRYDHAIGTLKTDGELRGYLACVVGNMSFPSRAPWLWFAVVWLDGSKKNPFEDYGPAWWTLRELDDGQFEGHGPSRRTEKRLLGWRIRGSIPGPPTTFDFEWLPAERGAVKWNELGLVDSDFLDDGWLATPRFHPCQPPAAAAAGCLTSAR